MAENRNKLDRAIELQERTKKFAIDIICAFTALPKTDEARVIGRQFLRSGTAVAANYRAACRARSKAEFVSRMGVVVEEADETDFWLELLVDAKVVAAPSVIALRKECRELLKIFASSLATAKANRNQ
jgi:four helix bundle protein